MTTILSIESSGNICSVALHQNGALLALIESDEPNIHGQKLAVFIKEITDLQNININDLDAIAVSEGPGSYTGLRIGVSIAKGICYASQIPLITVDTLKSLAFALLNTSDIILPDNALLMPMIDARRMEVYTAIFDKNLDKTASTKPLILDDSVLQSLGTNIYAFGNGALKINSNLFAGTHIPNIHFSAKHLGKIAFQKYLNNKFEDVAYFEPIYLKEFALVINK